MNQNLSFGKFAAVPRRVMFLALVLFALHGSAPLLGAQSALAPTAPSASDTASNASPAPPAPFGTPSNVIIAPTSLFNPFPPNAGFGSLRNPSYIPPSFGSGLEPAGLSSFAVTGPGNGGFASLFPVFSGQPQVRWGMAARPFGAAPGTPPPLSQLMRGMIRLPVASPFSNFLPVCRDTLNSGGNYPGSEFGRAKPSTIFATSNLGNGMFLSAGTGFGGRLAGAPFAPLGNASATPKRPGPSVAIKLSF